MGLQSWSYGNSDTKERVFLKTQRISILFHISEVMDLSVRTEETDLE